MNVSEEPAASIFRVCHDDGGRNFLQNTGDHLLTWYHITEARALRQTKYMSTLGEAV
jgi:hypothetical protein